VVFLRAAAWLVLACLMLQAGDTASSLYKQARQAEQKGDFTKAYLYAAQAVAIDPDKTEYWAYSEALRTRGMSGLKVEPKQGGAEPAPVDNGEPPLPQITPQEMREAREALPPPLLKGAEGRRTIDLKGNSRQLFEQVASMYGLLVVFDADYQPTKELTFRMEDATWREALRALETMTGSFVVPVSENVGLIAKDTAQKRTEIEPTMTVLIPYPEPLAVQDVQEAARAVQSTFDITKMAVDNALRVVLFRDRVSRVRPAIELFHQLAALRAQVFTEVELLTVSNTTSGNYGVDLPNSFSLAMLANPTPFAWALALDAAQKYLPFGGGKSRTAITITNAALFANGSLGGTQVLVKSELRGVDGQPAQMHVGDKYPVLTAGYFGGSPVGNPGQTFAPAPTISFEDLGVVLKVTPHVHNKDEVSLELEAEFETLTGQTSNGIPVIANRKITSKVRMRFDEVAVIAGLVASTVSRTLNGIPWVMQVPWLRTTSVNDDSQQLVLTVRPILISPPPSEMVTQTMWVGTETRPLTPMN
jgi:general secretion pathway protein D